MPLLVCPSRKSFLRTITGKDIAGVGPATLTAEIFATWQGADYIRTHDVAALCDALTVLAAIAGQPVPTATRSTRSEPVTFSPIPDPGARWSPKLSLLTGRCRQVPDPGADRAAPSFHRRHQ
jgi:hypothetical protein